MKTALKILGLLLTLAGGLQLYLQPKPERTIVSAEEKLPMPPTGQEIRNIINRRGTQSGKTIADRFPAPEEYQRAEADTTSFTAYLRNFPLLPIGTKVHLFNGDLKSRQDVHAAVLDLDVGNRDLQQCADAVMRLRAEYLLATGQEDAISFNFTNGFPAEYRRWKKGERIQVSGNKVSWVPGSAGTSNSSKSWKKYLNIVFAYAGTLSLEQELHPVSISELDVGDVFIRGGSPGHAVIVMDKAISPTTRDIAFLLAQSYMPAQQIHVLKNPASRFNSAWYFVSQLENELVTPEWTFGIDQLKRFD